MARRVLESEEKETMRVALRHVKKANFLRSTREMLLVSTSSSFGCQYSANWRMEPASWVVAEGRYFPKASEYFVGASRILA